MTRRSSRPLMPLPIETISPRIVRGGVFGVDAVFRSLGVVAAHVSEAAHSRA